MRIVPHHIIDSDTLPRPSIPITPLTISPSPSQLLPINNNKLGHPLQAAEGKTSEEVGDNQNVQQDNQPRPRQSTRMRRQAKWYNDTPQASKYAYTTNVLFVQDLFESLKLTRDQNQSHHPRVMKLVHIPNKPDTHPYIGTAMKSKDRSDWIDCLFQAYDKMYKTGTLSIPLPITMLDHNITILRPRLTCEVRITDTDHYYEEKIRFCTDGSRMVMGVDYDFSYASVIDWDILLLMIAVATSLGMVFYLLDISNAFQSNIIHDPAKRQYIHLPPLYME